MAQVHIVLPSLKVSGGNVEALRLGQDITRQGYPVDVLSMWVSPHPLPVEPLRGIPLSRWRTRAALALFQLPLIAARFFRHAWSARKVDSRKHQWLYTHYATLPLALLVPRPHRWFFVQDLEWRFAHWRPAAALLRAFILFMYRRGEVIAANAYLREQLGLLGVRVAVEAPIWADARYAVDGAHQRDIDVAMVLRKGAHKRLDLYLSLISRLQQGGRRCKLAVITPEDAIAAQVRGEVNECHVRPDLAAMASIYARSRLFLHLSDHEGFGLPPLEAMGAGCVPLCRDSGGVRAYMRGPLEPLLMPLADDVAAIAGHVHALLADPSRLKHYSVLAQEAFRAGLATSQSRTAAIASLLR